MRRLLGFVLAVSFAPLVPFAVAACDDLNKPAAVPKSEPRRQCFSDVECPGEKCMKSSSNEIQGTCVPNGGSSGAPGAPARDGGAPTEDPSLTPGPDARPQPGDIHI